MQTDTTSEDTHDLEEDEPDEDGPFLTVYEREGGGIRILAASSRFTVAGWGIILADIARLVASAPATDDREAAERLVEMRRVFWNELEDPTDTLKVKKLR